jgi:glutamate-1-semialdehyde 2,1-aminomutase
VVHDWCYHGSVDETFATLDAAGRTVSRRGNIGAPVDPAETTVVVEFNDVDGLERAPRERRGRGRPGRAGPHQRRHRAARPGLPRRLRELTRRYDVLGQSTRPHALRRPGGYTRAHGLEPDVLTMGKAIVGGSPPERSA